MNEDMGDNLGPEPCQPIGCDAGFHLSGCIFENDDDGDDDDEPADGESFDGGFGPDSYFNRAMHKND